MGKIELLPSVLSADFANLGRDLRDVEEAGVHAVHIDVMDGTFVPSLSLGFPVISSMRRVSGLFFDVHLMVEEPGRYVELAAEAGADRIGVHAEACRHLHRTIQQIRAAGKEACVVLNPATPLAVLEYVLGDVDAVLLMTVNPGFGGQAYIPSMTEKICSLRKLLAERELSVPIEVDGGMKPDNVRQVLDAGASLIVAGSSVFNGRIGESIRAFQRVFAEYSA
ncbi:MAG TPA: ribulose-phosphate 3-epimerase [Lachnospiraceae bacterium]|nr:ribulose-phosphate 3-epimerase [Lachnospiraceae bacterium]